MEFEAANNVMSAQSPEIDAYVKLIRTADALHGEVTKGLTEEGITASQFSAMKALRFYGPLPQKEVAAHMLKTAGNVTLVLDNLEKRELIDRQRQVHDRRVISVRLTAIGVSLFDRLYPPHIDRIRKAMKGLDQEGIDALSALLQELRPSVCEPLCSPEADGESHDRKRHA